MADIAVPRTSHSPTGIHAERVEEGRWEGEGGGPLHKPLSTAEKSADVPISSLAKDDVTARTSSSDGSEKQTTIQPADYNPSTVHPSVVEGSESGKLENSKYAAPASSSAADEGKLSVPEEGKTAAAEEGKEGDHKAAPQRKKSISERLQETWQDLKHKVEDLTHKKS